MNKKSLLKIKLPSIKVQKISDWAFWVILCVFLYVLTRIGLYELLNMKFYGTDFCLYDNAIWNASRGSWLHCNMLHGRSYLGVHFSLILFLLVPFYWLGAGSWILILVRSAAAAGGAVLIRLYAKKYAGLPAWVASIFGISFLLHPMVHMATLSEFHGTILELFFIPLLFVALESKKRWFFWVSLFLLLSVREDTWLYTTGLAILILWQRDRKLAVQVCLVSVLWGVLALEVFMPFFWGGTKAVSKGNVMFSLYLARYRGYSWSNLVPFFKPRLLADVKLLFPLAFLPLLGGRYFILMLIPLIQIQLGQTDLMKCLLLHYSACIVPFAYIAGIQGWRNIKTFYESKYPRGLKLAPIIMCVLLVCFSFLSLKNSIVLKDRYHEIFTRHLINLRMKTAYKILKKIPRNASLSLQGSLFHVGAHRKNVYIFSGIPPQHDFPGKKTEFIMIDEGRLFVQVHHYNKVIEKLLEGHEYGVVQEEDGFVLLKRGYPLTKNATALHHYKYRIQGEATNHTTGFVEWGKRFDWKAARIAREKRDKNGILSMGSYRFLEKGDYYAVFAIYLKDGVKGWDAVGLEIREKSNAGPGPGRGKILCRKTIKFNGAHERYFITKLFFSIKKDSLAEPVAFYGGHGTVGLDYVEFFKIKGNVSNKGRRDEKTNNRK